MCHSLPFQRLHSCLLANLANFVTFVKFDRLVCHLQKGPLVLSFALTCWLLAKLAKMSKFQPGFAPSCLPFLQSFSGMNGFISVKSCTVISEKKVILDKKMIRALCIITEGSEYTCHKTVQ